MPPLRRSRLPGLMLLLVLGFALLLPELAHSLAHRDLVRLAGVAMDDHGHGHGHHHEQAAEAHHQDVMLAVGMRAAAVHPHFELCPIAPNKTSFPLFLGARTVVESGFDVTLRPTSPTFRQDQLAIVLRNHGPPLPSRAPPLS